MKANFAICDLHAGYDPRHIVVYDPSVSVGDVDVRDLKAYHADLFSRGLVPCPLDDCGVSKVVELDVAEELSEDTLKKIAQLIEDVTLHFFESGKEAERLVA